MRSAQVVVILGVLCAAGPLPAQVLDYGTQPLPDSSLVDFSSLLDAPAGKHGFLRVRDGHFRFADGTRARFFGVNVAKDTVFAPRPVIDRAVNVLARAGVNMVRLHHIDDRQGIIAADGRLEPARVEALDYWISRLRERGIYVYLDLLDYRTFASGEGIPNAHRLGRGAKPYAVFDRRLRDEQLDYAKALLVDHVNRYTSLPYAKDPAVAIIEICDENGLFARTDWPRLEEPYRRDLTSRWNRWLADRYGSTAALRRAWTNTAGVCALGKGESLEQGSVLLPHMGVPATPNLNYRDRLFAAARRNDGARFAHAVHRAYFAEMRGYLRSLGVQAAITATMSMDVAPDLHAVACELDATCVNFYWDHPAFADNADWRSAAFFAMGNPFAGMPPNAFAPTISAARVWGKPLIVREWGYCYPNPYRSAGMLEAAAYGAMLDVDVMLLFTYQPRAELSPLSFFDVRTDPVRWSLVGPAAHIFLGGGVKPAPDRLALLMGTTDEFNYSLYAHAAHRLSWVLPVETVYLEGKQPEGAALYVGSGRSGVTRYAGSDTLMYWNERNADLGYTAQVTAPERGSGYAPPARAPAGGYQFSGVLYDRGTKPDSGTWIGFDLAWLQKQGYSPIGRSGRAAYGFYDARRRNWVFPRLTDRDLLGATLDALAKRGIGMGHREVDSQQFTSATGEIVREGEKGRLRVVSPTVRAIAGDLPPETSLGEEVALTGLPKRGTLVILAVDGKPIAQSERLLVAWADDAANRGQALVAARAGDPKPFVLALTGQVPVSTGGHKTEKPLGISIAGKPALAAYVTGGTWQVLLEPERARVWCDLPGVRLETPGREQATIGGG